MTCCLLKQTKGGKMTSAKTSLFRKILYPIEFVLYITCFILAMMTLFGDLNLYSYTQAKTVALTSGGASIAIFIPAIVQKISKKKISPVIDMVLLVSFLLSVFIGEACQVYLRLSWWDKFLHFIATAGLSLLFYVLGKMIIDKIQPSEEKKKSKTIFALVFGCLCAVMFEVCWEVYEFAADSILGTNMQKYVPDEYYDVILEDGSLDMSMEAVFEFFSTKDGYTYALQDTMLDIVTDVGGGITGAILSGVLFHFKPELADNIILLHEKTENAEPDSSELQTVSELNASPGTGEDVIDNDGFQPITEDDQQVGPSDGDGTDQNS